MSTDRAILFYTVILIYYKQAIYYIAKYGKTILIFDNNNVIYYKNREQRIKPIDRRIRKRILILITNFTY
jgi:hypothetical protein